MANTLHGVIPLAALHPQSACEKLNVFLEAHPEVTMTLTHRGSLADLHGQLERTPSLRIAHAICEAGTALFHLNGTEGWQEDQRYRAWAESFWKPRDLERFVEWGIPKGMQRMLGGYSSRHLVLEVLPEHEPEAMRAALQQNLEREWLKADVWNDGVFVEVVPPGVNRGSALAFLRQQAPSFTSLMAWASSPTDLELLREATYPVLLEGCGLDFETPGVPRDRTSMASQPGAFGVLESLLRWAFHQGLP